LKVLLPYYFLIQLFIAYVEGGFGLPSTCKNAT
jgi:hypothetical protein